MRQPVGKPHLDKRLTGALQLLAPTYTNADFGIGPYVSPHDTDGDGIDDQTDILASARAYVETRPAYGSAYYEGGWPDDGRGVCTDVVAYALLGAGFSEAVQITPAGMSLAEAVKPCTAERNLRSAVKALF